jgi:lipoate-protein ligase B
MPLNITGLVTTTQTNVVPLPQADYTGYLRKLEQVLIHALHQFGVKGEQIKKRTGVWVNGSKIAAIGVKVDSHGITRHGFALNVAPDMTYWDGIIGCGLSGYSVTSLAVLLSNPPSMQQVVQSIIIAFQDVFDVACQIVS